MLNRLRFNLSAAPPRTSAWHSLPSLRLRLIWTIGNFLMLAGLYLLLYVGGVYSQIEYNRNAARGDNDIPAQRILMDREAASPLQPAAEPAPSFFRVPVINNANPATGTISNLAQQSLPSTITRVIIPSINVDYKVVEVGWHIEDQNGSPVAVWEVAEYAVGHHKGSANPGEGNNVVLAGHVGGYGKVFKDLFYLKPGDQITMYSGGQQYLYVVQDRLVLDEEGQPPEQREANARYIEPTDHEVVTLITCWPPKGPQKFTQRVVVRAVPFSSAPATTFGDGPGAWTIR